MSPFIEVEPNDELLIENNILKINSGDFNNLVSVSEKNIPMSLICFD